MTTQEFNRSLRSNCFGEFVDQNGDSTVMYIDFDETENCIMVCTVCNVGLLVDFTVQYDDDISLDENLQNVAEEVYLKGYTDLN